MSTWCRTKLWDLSAYVEDDVGKIGGQWAIDWGKSCKPGRGFAALSFTFCRKHYLLILTIREAETAAGESLGLEGS
jgi:hypothetical protein